MTRGYHWLGSSSTCQPRGSPAAFSPQVVEPVDVEQRLVEPPTLLVGHLGER